MKLTLTNPLFKRTYKDLENKTGVVDWLCYQLPINTDIDELKAKLKPIELDLDKKKRSLTANSYLFVLLTKLASKLGNSLGNQYVMAIRDYGQVVEGMAMHKQAFEVFEHDWNVKSTSIQHTLSMVEVTNEFNSKGIDWVEFICFRGSSEYDSKQFSILLDGVIRDCNEQNIETISTEEVERLIKSYVINS